MSWKIQIIRAKPNPLGKDTNQHRPLADQLLGEWVDLKNIGDTSCSANVLNLAHSEFGPGCRITEQSRIYWTGNASVVLGPGQTIRVHTGRSADAWQMAAIDRDGTNHRSFAERGTFVLNNDCGDNLSVWWQASDGKWHSEDAAGYKPRPAEGRILQRVGNELI